MNYSDQLLSWTCHICGKERPDDKISVYSEDTSKLFDLPPGTMQRNVRYCNDNPTCEALAPTRIDKPS